MGINILSLILIPEQISGNKQASGLLLSTTLRHEYIDGKPTENIVEILYETVFPDNLFEKISVRIKGSKPVITNEEIKKNGGTVKIQFTNLSGRFYRSKSGEYALSVTADGIEVIS